MSGEKQSTMNRNKFYIKVCASIDSIDENIVTTISCDEKYYKDEPLDLNGIDCKLKLCVGDMVCLHIQLPKCVYKITPYETPKEIEGKVTFCSDEFGIIDEKYLCFRKLFNVPLRLNARIKATVILGCFQCEQKEYDFRCLEINCVSEAQQQEKQQAQGNMVKKPENMVNRMNQSVVRRSLPKQRFGSIFKNFYNLPDELIDAYEDRHLTPTEIKRTLDLFMPKEECTIENYATSMHNCVFLEEMHMRNEFAAYRSDEACFECDSDAAQGRQGLPTTFSFRFHLDNNELRPRILVGDYVYAKKVNAPSIPYSGRVKGVSDNLFKIKFRKDFAENFNSEQYIIEFRYHRTVYLKRHEAIDNALVKFDENFLFPSRELAPKMAQLDVELEDGKLMLDDEEIPWFNDKLNTEQMRAVVEALRAECRPLPFMIQGPPGTGKTSVIVEIVLQLHKLFPTHRVLITTQSNTAADVVTTRLLQAHAPIAADIVRLISNSVYEADTTSKELENNCVCLKKQHVDDEEENEEDEGPDGKIKKCSVEYLKTFRIVVSTCVSIGVISRNEIDNGHFGHIIVEEAGQCEEPESLIPLTLIDSNHGQIIMAGDPRQLPPMVMSLHAKAREFDVSMFERLLKRYKTDEMALSGAVDHRLVQKLVRNYRALPSIVGYYNKLFYDSKLIPTISPENSAEARLLSEVRRQGILPVSPKQAFGLFFVDVCNGRNRQREGLKSWLNSSEACAIQKMANKLLEIVPQDQIGIITPYYAQVVLLKRIFRRAKDLLIGSVEQLQGEERQIILISTVRTEGRAMNLRFVFCPKRVNTAVSRARSIVVVLGKGALLREDPNWNEYIQSCEENGTFISDPSTC